MLSQTAEYALRAAVYLGQAHARAQTTRQIAAATGVPGGYLAKVLQSLSRAGIVRSQRGLHGGFVLEKSPADWSVLDVLDAVDPLRRITGCPLGRQHEPPGLCPLHRRLDEAMAAMEATFRRSTIADLLSDPAASTPWCDGGRTGAGPTTRRGDADPC